MSYPNELEKLARLYVECRIDARRCGRTVSEILQANERIERGSAAWLLLQKHRKARDQAEDIAHGIGVAMGEIARNLQFEIRE